MFLFYLAFFSLLLGDVSLISGYAVSGALFPLAFLISFFSTSSSVFNISEWRETLKDLAVGLGIVFLTIAVAAFFYDNSFDGNTYHQEIVASLLDGWNPYDYAQFLSYDCDIWTRHYAKGTETAAACIAAFTGNLESGKAINYILTLGALLIFADFLSDRLPRLKGWRLWTVALLAVGNPVVMAQLQTFYIDYTKYILFLLTLVFLFRLVRSRDSRRGAAREEVNIVFATIFCVSVKFNIFCEQFILLFLAFIFLLSTHDRKSARRLAFSGAVALLAGLALNRHPYLHNHLYGGSPFYPLLGGDSIDIMTSNTPPRFGHGRLADFMLSLFSIHIPNTDARAGGFGPLMGLILILSFGLLIYYRKRTPGAVWYIVICTLLSCFIYEQSWWARYICQLWIIPVATLVTALKYDFSRRLRNLLAVMMAASSLLSFGYSAMSSASAVIYRETVYSAIGGDRITVINPQPQTLRHLREAGISYVTAGEPVIPPGKRGVVFYGNPESPADFRNFIILVVDPASAAEIERRSAKWHLDVSRKIIPPTAE